MMLRGHHAHRTWRHVTFLWGYMKDKGFSTPPRDIDELRGTIIREFNALVTTTAWFHSTESARYAQANNALY